MYPRRLSVATLALLSVFAVPAFAQDPVPTPQFTPAQTPVAPVTPVAPTEVTPTKGPIAIGAIGQPRRIKRTVPLDPAALEGRWDVLYRPSETTTVYFDWDSNFLYFAYESPTPEPVRFDLDGNNDGWLRGADNLSVQVTPLNAGTPPQVTFQKMDAATDKNRPVYSSETLPPNAYQTASGMTTRGTHVTFVAVGRTELYGLERKADKTFGLRVEPGVLPAPVGSVALVSTQPLMSLTLIDNMPATERNIRVVVKLISPRERTAGDDIRAVLEAKNEGKQPVSIARLFLRGSQNTISTIDAATFTGLTLAPGETTKRELKSSVSAETPIGSLVLVGGAEFPDGNSVSALATFDRVEPYAIYLTTDTKPVLIGEGGVRGATRDAIVYLKSRSGTSNAKVSIKIPTGWSLDGNPQQSIRLRWKDDVRQLKYRLLIPASATSGEYPVEVTAEIDGKTYTSIRLLTLTAM